MNIKYIKESEEWTITSYDIVSGFDQNKYFSRSYNKSWILNNENLGFMMSVNMNLTLSRRSSYFVYNLIVPLLVIVSLSIAMITVPSNADNKPELLLSILVAFTLYQLLLAECIPKTDSTPLLGFYIIDSLILCALDIFIVCFIMYLHFNGKQKAPILVCKVFIRPVRFCLTTIKKGFLWFYYKLVCRRVVNLTNGMIYIGKSFSFICSFLNIWIELITLYCLKYLFSI